MEYNKIISAKNDGIYVYLGATLVGLKDTIIVANNFVTATQVGMELYAIKMGVRNNSIFSNNSAPTLTMEGNAIPSYSVCINNIVQNKGSGPAAYFTTAAIHSDHNDFFSAGSKLLYYDSSGYLTDLSSWQSATNQDSSSISINPQFTNTSKGDLHIKASSSSGVSRKGIYQANYPLDIDAERRPHKACDIGADQFTFENNDVGVTDILFPGLKSCPDSVTYVGVQVSNLGLNPETGFKVFVSAKGPDTVSTSYYFSNRLSAKKDTIILVSLPHALKTTHAGTYAFTVYTNLVNDTDRYSDTFRTSFNFREGLVSKFSFRSPSCAGDITFFSDSSKGKITSYHWDFGDGFTSSKKNSLHSFLTPGKHITSLLIKNANGCSDISQVTINVDTADARFSYNFNGTSVDFKPNIKGMKLYTWDFGDGSPRDTTRNPSHTFPTNKKYRVSLFVTTPAGCSGTWSDSINQVLTDLAMEEKTGIDFSVYPNPFNESTIINYKLEKAMRINVEVYDVWGRRLATLLNKNEESGSYNLKFSPRDYNIKTSGIFILKISAGTYTNRKSIIMTE